VALMKAVGVKQLKARLSEYLRLVKSGETILVTERTDVVAELRPARRSLPRADALDEVLDALADAGQLARASLPKKGWTMRCRGLGLPQGTTAALLDEIRGDRA
jgi:antitoxin (DNA-binding transcriptional repressor) of toxin-antitoxin stability system